MWVCDWSAVLSCGMSAHCGSSSGSSSPWFILAVVHPHRGSSGGVTTQKKTLRIRHLLLMGSGVICALIGIVAIVSNKIIHEKSVVSTLHFVTRSVIEHLPPLCLLCPLPLPQSPLCATLYIASAVSFAVWVQLKRHTLCIGYCLALSLAPFTCGLRDASQIPGSTHAMLGTLAVSLAVFQGVFGCMKYYHKMHNHTAVIPCSCRLNTHIARGGSVGSVTVRESNN